MERLRPKMPLLRGAVVDVWTGGEALCLLRPKMPLLRGAVLVVCVSTGAAVACLLRPKMPVFWGGGAATVCLRLPKRGMMVMCEDVGLGWEE